MKDDVVRRCGVVGVFGEKDVLNLPSQFYIVF